MGGFYRYFYKKYGNKLGCFSPPVMLATFCIEILLALWTAYRYVFGRLAKLSILLFIFLAIFQLAEYMVCGGLGMSGIVWSKIGYVAITMLPPLGIHMTYEINKAEKRPLLIPAYVFMVGFIAYFFISTSALTGHLCLGNYVIFQMGSLASHLYSVYYYGLVLLALGMNIYMSRRVPKNRPKRKRAHTAFAFGYGAFLLPTTTVNLLNPATIKGIPSIMCGFAVLLALIVSCFVLPDAAAIRKSRTKIV